MQRVLLADAGRRPPRGTGIRWSTVQRQRRAFRAGLVFEHDHFLQIKVVRCPACPRFLTRLRVLESRVNVLLENDRVKLRPEELGGTPKE